MLKSGTQKFLRQISSGKQALIAPSMQINAFLPFKKEYNIPKKKDRTWSRSIHSETDLKSYEPDIIFLDVPPLQFPASLHA